MAQPKKKGVKKKEKRMVLKKEKYWA